ncbi:envelope stress response membrane protein PspB [Sphingomonas sp.]|jgi:phage shock protein B|uniref:envelope stress response membrane protein PspB n=1 Tax=Sphingomonas sp. TaxID=28214 RepID=UPI002ED7CE62
MEDVIVPMTVIPAIFIGMPWVIMHYITKWKQAPKITEEDEKMLDEMYNLARRLEDRLNTVERIVAADNPDWKPGLGSPQPTFQIDRHPRSN